MKVFIIEDDDNKAAEIESTIGEIAGADGRAVTFVRVDALADGARLLGSTKFDLMILDLMLPYIKGGEASSTAGLELLRQVRGTGGPNAATRILGVSAFPQEIAAHRATFEAAGVLIADYSDAASWRGALSGTLSELHGGAPTIDVDFLAICALDEEREGFSSCVTNVSRANISGLNVHFVKSALDSKLSGAIIRLRRMGLVSSAQESALALSIFRTEVFFMTGICAGFKARAKIGQLIVASPAWEYQAGKWSEKGFAIEPYHVGLRPKTSGVIDHEIGKRDFLEWAESGLDRRYNRPPVFSDPELAPFATGSAVIADASRLAHIEEQHRKIAAIDMETYGVYYSAEYAASPPQHFFSIKSVVDFADAAKGDDLHHYGSHVSARAGMRLASALVRAQQGQAAGATG